MNWDFLEIKFCLFSFEIRSFRMMDAEPINYFKVFFYFSIGDLLTWASLY